MRPAVDALIKDLWDTIDFNVRDDDPSLRHPDIAPEAKNRERNTVAKPLECGSLLPLLPASLLAMSLLASTGRRVESECVAFGLE